MKGNIFSDLFIFLLMSWLGSIPALAEEFVIKAEKGTFTLELSANLINLRAKQASIKDIPYEIEQKKGIKTDVCKGSDDNKSHISYRICSINRKYLSAK